MAREFDYDLVVLDLQMTISTRLDRSCGDSALSAYAAIPACPSSS